MDYVTLRDITDRYEGTITNDQQTWVLSLIGDACSLVRSRLPQLDTWIASGQVSTSEVRRVVSEIILRRVRNPKGFRQENAGDYGYSRDPIAASGRLYVTDEELDDMRPPADPAKAGVGSATLAIPGWRVP